PIVKLLLLHFSFILFLRLNNTTYDCLYKITLYKHYHLIHTISLLMLIYLINKSFIKYFIDNITSEEQSNINDNLLYYLTDVILIISVFTSSFSIIHFIVFVLVINFKIINWILDIRSKLTSDYKVVVYGLIIWLLTIPCFFITLVQSLSNPSIQILFCYEFFLVMISLCKNISNVLLNNYLIYLEKNDNSSDSEDKIDNIKLVFGLIIELTYLASKLTTILVFFIYTTLNLRIPFNVLREFIRGITIFAQKLKNWYKLMSLLKFIEKCKIVQGTCPICREDMEMGREIWCGHGFHSVCIKRWAEKQMQCPVCRKEIMTKNDGIPVQLIQ
ncbi:hypothetical protein H311_00088, partial [Anncaliia algerae PRA109]